MITLALVRHAKSDWAEANLKDHDRPLNERGARDAPRMARQLAETGYRPDRILSSTALRAHTTATDFSSEFGVPVELLPELYGAGSGMLLRTAARFGGKSVMIVAHDPGLSVLAAQLSDDGIAHMPTCAVATFTWDADDWAAVDAIDPDDWTFASPR